jgi:hypothetical protein
LSHIFFTDRDLGKQFPQALKAGGLTVERHGDLFLPDGSDEQWLEHCGKHRRIAISHNERIRYTPNELAAVRRHKVALIIVVGKVPLPMLAANFVRTIDKIDAFIQGATVPFIAKVYLPRPDDLARNPDAIGRIESWYP